LVGLRWLVGIGIAALSCWLLVRELDWRELSQALRGADYRWVGGGLAMVFIAFFPRTWRWQSLLGWPRAGFRTALTSLLVGQVLNIALPMRGGDPMRAVWATAGEDVKFPQALGSIALEKLLDLLVLFACVIVLVIWIPLPDWSDRAIWGIALLSAVGAGCLWAGLRWRDELLRWVEQHLKRLPAGWSGAIAPFLRRLVDGLEVIRHPGTLRRAALWTGLIWMLGTFINLAVLSAFGLPSALAALVLLVALLMAGAVPIPAGLGVFEGVCVVILTLFGWPRDQALAAGLVLHLVVMGPPLVAAAVLLVWPGQQAAREGHASP
jgi:uncharacterized protein (TIRG00374 family)